MNPSTQRITAAGGSSDVTNDRTRRRTGMPASSSAGMGGPSFGLIQQQISEYRMYAAESARPGPMVANRSFPTGMPAVGPQITTMTLGGMSTPRQPPAQ